ncbi:MAG: hypothetical protein KJ626_07500 [Verrucomicrobia bacterium]|nr:hypothetical protein [Verrucomicrobiota bacterium]
MSTTTTFSDEAEAERPSVLHRVLMYIPNRVLDIFDMVRLRVRVGPGLAAGVRATEFADVYAGSYASVYVGLPGPRSRKIPRLPVGLESFNGLEVSAAQLATGAGMGPDYSTTEIGASAHLFIVGVDAGFDPMEIVDLIGGFFCWDPRGDDL